VEILLLCEHLLAVTMALTGGRFCKAFVGDPMLILFDSRENLAASQIHVKQNILFI
jgi:hypothetical protein